MNERILAWTTHRDREKEGRKNRNYRKCNKKDKQGDDIRNRPGVSENIGERQLRIAPKVINTATCCLRTYYKHPARRNTSKKTHLCSQAA